MPVIAEVYMISAILGALVLAASAVLGGMGHGHAGHGGHGGHGIGHGGSHGALGHGGLKGQIGHGGGHAGSAGHAGAGGHAGSHAGGHAGPRAAGHAAASHGSGTAAHNAGVRAAAQGSSTDNNSAAVVAASTSPLAGSRTSEDRWLFLLTILNPTTLSAFAVWFGAIGLFSWRLFGFLPVPFTLPVAIAGGFIGTKLTLFLMSTIVNRMYSSGSFTQDSLIGSQAEVTCSIQDGHLGEITCGVSGGARFTASARSATPGQSFHRGCAVIIANMENDIAYVEAWPEDVLPSDPQHESTIDAPAEKPVKLPEKPI